MANTDFKYWVKSRDNYDPGDGWIFCAGFEAAEQAIAYAKEMVDAALNEAYKSGMSALSLYDWYSYGAEQPEVVSKKGHPPADFDTIAYVCIRIRAICEGAEVDPNSVEGRMKAFRLAHGRIQRKLNATAAPGVTEVLSRTGESNE